MNSVQAADHKSERTVDRLKLFSSVFMVLFSSSNSTDRAPARISARSQHPLLVQHIEYVAESAADNCDSQPQLFTQGAKFAR